MKSRLSSHSISPKWWLICKKHAELFLNARIHTGFGRDCPLAETPNPQLLTSLHLSRVSGESPHFFWISLYTLIRYSTAKPHLTPAFKHGLGSLEELEMLWTKAGDANSKSFLYIYNYPPPHRSATRMTCSCCGCYWCGLEKKSQTSPEAFDLCYWPGDWFRPS